MSLENWEVAQFAKDLLTSVRDTVSYAWIVGDVSQEVRDKFHRRIDNEIRNVYIGLGEEYKEEEDE